MDIKEYLASNRWLPWFMRDFHDQKDLFKTIEQKWPNAKEMDISWVLAHVYVVDRFLKFMAFHGYTLQKSRAKGVQFGDIHWTLLDAGTERSQAFLTAIDKPTPQEPSRETTKPAPEFPIDDIDPIDLEIFL
jgi:hypothetical protein